MADTIFDIPAGGGQLRVFIVEDSDPVKRRLIAALSDVDGVEVVGNAQSEAEAIQGILVAAPDVAILDIQLHKGNGMNVLQEVKRRQTGLKIIVLTNFGYPQYRQRCLKAGADYFLDKSSEFMAVETIIAEWAKARKSST
jgi:DNA-binding NarL/FixJ family response regulator